MRYFLSASLLSVALLAAMPMIGHAQTMTTTTAQNDAPLLSFSITEEVKSTPDAATVGAGVQTMAPTAVQAMRDNAVKMQKLVDAIKGRGIPAKDIQTTGISLSPQYDYSRSNNGEPPRFVGYQVSNQVRVKTRDIPRLGEMLDAMVVAGGTNIDGPSFFAENVDAQMDAARATAFRKAQERANRYAQIAGYRSARLVSLSEGMVTNGGPVPVAYMRAASMDKAGAAPVEPGQVSNSLNISVQYKLER